MDEGGRGREETEGEAGMGDFFCVAGVRLGRGLRGEEHQDQVA